MFKLRSSKSEDTVEMSYEFSKLFISGPLLSFPTSFPGLRKCEKSFALAGSFDDSTVKVSQINYSTTTIGTRFSRTRMEFQVSYQQVIFDRSKSQERSILEF